MVQIPNSALENLEPYLLGNNDRPLPRFRSRRTKAILAYLAVKQRPITREHLAALFWPDEPTSIGRGNLSRDLHNLTKILPDCWELDRQSVAFFPADHLVLDTYLLDKWEKELQFNQAAALVRGEFMEGLYLNENPDFESWLQHEREVWRGKTESVLQHAIQYFENIGELPRAIELTHQLLEIAPWQESAHQSLMKLLCWSGQNEKALRQYVLCQNILLEELDVEPQEETQTLYQQIKTGRLPPPPRKPAFLTRPDSQRQSSQSVFVAREQEIERLESTFLTAVDGKPQFMFVAGNPGQGKTALLDKFTDHVLRNYPQALVAKGNCSTLSGVGDPYHPFKEIMGLLTGDVEALWDAGAISTTQATRLWLATPVVIEHLLTLGRQVFNVMVPPDHLYPRCQDAASSNEEWAKQCLEFMNTSRQPVAEFEQNYLFKQFSNVLGEITKEQPVLLILDDIHWADLGSIGLLFHLGKQLAQTKHRLMVLCAYRPLEIQLLAEKEGHSISNLLNEFKRTYGDIWIQLGQEPEDVRKDFIEAFLETEPNALSKNFRTELFRRTQGHPLFTVELLRAMQDRGDVYLDENQVWQEEPTLDWRLLPSRIEAVIEDRIERLKGNMKELISIASVVGETFTSKVVADVLGQDEHAVVEIICQTLAGRYRLVIEDGSLALDGHRIYRFRFRHILYQEFIYTHLTQAEKQILHLRVALAMENFNSQDFSGLAYHFYTAGDEKKALQYFGLAGQHALDVYSNQEAEILLRSALALTKDKNEKAQINSSLSEAVFRLNHLDEAKTFCRQGINYFLEQRDLDQVAKLYNLICRIEKATSLIKFLATVIEGLERLENAPASEEMVIFYLNCVRAHYFNHRFEELKSFIQKIEEMAEHLGTTSARTVALYAKSYQLLATNANQEDIKRLYKTVIEVNETAKDSMFYMHLAYVNLAICLRNENPKTALGYSHEAIKIAKQVGSMLQEGNARTLLIRTLVFAGNFSEAKNELDKLENVSKNADHEFSHLAYPAIAQSIFYCYQGYHQNAENILYRIWPKMIETKMAQTITVGLLLGEILIELNKTTEARNIVDLLRKEYYSILQTDHKLKPFTLSALIELSMGETKKAKETLEKTIKTYGKDLRWSRNEMLYYMRAKGMLLITENQWDNAWEIFSKAIDMASSAGFHWMRTRLRLHWAEAHFSRGGKDYIEDGTKMMEYSRSEFKEMGADGWVQIIDKRMNELGIISKTK